MDLRYGLGLVGCVWMVRMVWMVVAWSGYGCAYACAHLGWAGLNLSLIQGTKTRHCLGVQCIARRAAVCAVCSLSRLHA